jgi:hypothetical protein
MLYTSVRFNCEPNDSGALMKTMTFSIAALNLLSTSLIASVAHAGTKPTDIYQVCSGTVQVTGITDLHEETYYQQTRLKPVLFTKTVGTLQLTPKEVSSGCAQMGFKYLMPVTLTDNISATIKKYGSAKAEILALLGGIYTFNVEHTFYELDTAGELPLYPKYEVSEQIKFQTEIQDLETVYDQFVDGEAVYGLKAPKSTDEKLKVASELAADIISGKMDPNNEAPMFQYLARLYPSFDGLEEFNTAKYQNAIDTYVSLLLEVLESTGSETNEIQFDSGLVRIAKEINSIMTYEYGTWSTTDHSQKVVEIAAAHPLLFSKSILAHGYEYTLHFQNLGQVEELLEKFKALSVKEGNSKLGSQVKLAVTAIYEEAIQAKNHQAPQYSLSPKALELVHQILGL